jgi:hypothetical protein
MYETTLGSTIDIKAVKEKLIENFISHELHKENVGVDNSLKIKPVYITGYYTGEDDIPLFTHSIIVNYKGTDYLCTDLRLYINTKEYKENKNIGKCIRNLTEYNFIRSKSILELAWVNGDKDFIRDNLKFAAIVYSVNISEALARAYALDAGDRLKLNILGLVFYRSLFLAKDELDHDAKETALIHTMKVLGVNEKLFRDTIDPLNDLHSINDYIAGVKSILDNNRINNFNLVGLLTLIRNSWYGTNSKDYIAGALEHIPTWVAIVYTAVNEKSYKSSMIYKISDKLKKSGNIENFVKTYESLITKYLINATIESIIDDIEFEMLKY